LPPKVLARNPDFDPFADPIKPTKKRGRPKKVEKAKEKEKEKENDTISKTKADKASAGKKPPRKVAKLEEVSLYLSLLSFLFEPDDYFS